MPRNKQQKSEIYKTAANSNNNKSNKGNKVVKHFQCQKKAKQNSQNSQQVCYLWRIDVCIPLKKNTNGICKLIKKEDKLERNLT